MLSKAKKKIYLGAGFGAMAVACVAGYYLFSHVRTRVFVWLNPTADIEGKTAIDHYFQNGAKIDGCKLVEKSNIQIK